MLNYEDDTLGYSEMVMDWYVRMVMWSGCLSVVVACSARVLAINVKDGYVMHKKRTTQQV
jgi:hypothetical protein